MTGKSGIPRVVCDRPEMALMWSARSGTSPCHTACLEAATGASKKSAHQIAASLDIRHSTHTRPTR